MSNAGETFLFLSFGAQNLFGQKRPVSLQIHRPRVIRDATGYMQIRWASLCARDNGSDPSAPVRLPRPVYFGPESVQPNMFITELWILSAGRTGTSAPWSPDERHEERTLPASSSALNFLTYAISPSTSPPRNFLSRARPVKWCAETRKWLCKIEAI